jgi:hypothetical protein
MTAGTGNRKSIWYLSNDSEYCGREQDLESLEHIGGPWANLQDTEPAAPVVPVGAANSNRNHSLPAVVLHNILLKIIRKFEELSA